MSICPNCNHPNPAGATQCEACFTPLPATASCPSCGAVVQLDATFCGQCGTNLKSTGSAAPVSAAPIPQAAPVASESALPPTIIAGGSSTVVPAPAVVEPVPVMPEPFVEPILEIEPEPILPPPTNSGASGSISLQESSTNAAPTLEPIAPSPDPITPAAVGHSSTQLQQQGFQLSHIQSGTVIDIPNNVSVIHIGKPNEQIPPDIDVSGFPCAEVVSRVHADLRIEGDSIYIEDVGSANGTYVNHNVLPKGNRHLLRVGDRISLGKGDLVTFLFHTS